ncbi:hypothetical protein ACIQMV_19540 [Streptomyces sp. NPDC091412]|uniref:hypothetical protein n=1 Tax=Streptomyces sp. NPDC091412 TaxID=3366002 RepID=UPI0037FA5E52
MLLQAHNYAPVITEGGTVNDMLLAGLLGATITALVLLYRSHTRHEALITQLRAELAAEKIARITAAQARPPSPVSGDEPEPVRRKRHLTLYIGGGVVAIIHSLRGRSRQVWKHHRAATVTAAAGVVAAAGTTVALLMPSSSNATPTPGGPDGATPAVSPEAAPVSGTPPSKDDMLSVYDTTAEEPLDEGDLESPASPSQASDPASTTAPATEDDAGTTPAATPDATPQAPADPPPAVPPAVHATPASTSAPALQPPSPPAEENDQDSGKKGICVEVPKLLDLCLLGGK